MSLSSEQVVKLISSDRLPVSSDEKVFQSVIGWVKYDLDAREVMLPQLMEHIRLPLTTEDYILKNVLKEPLIKNCLKSYNYVLESLNTLKSEELIPQSIQNKPRHGEKVILVVGGNGSRIRNSLEWFDTRTNLWHLGPELITDFSRHGLVVTNDNFLYALGGIYNGPLASWSVFRLDLSLKSPRWRQSVNMLVERQFLGVGVINDKIYAVGGKNAMEANNRSAEVFDHNTQAWRMISSMSTIRCLFSTGVLNDLLYVVGGYDESRQTLNIVECYNPSCDRWSLVANMCLPRAGAGVGALYGELYAVGGQNGSNLLSSVEKYSPKTGVWTTVAHLNVPRKHAAVVILDGLLYAVGGMNESSNLDSIFMDKASILDSVERYDPITNTWAMVTSKWNIKRFSSGVLAINRPQHFTTC